LDNKVFEHLTVRIARYNTVTSRRI